MDPQIIILDFGSQTTHLIARRLRDLGITTKIADPEESLETIETHQPKGLILSGGPACLSEENAPTTDERIFDLGIPILGICYGWQLTAYLLGGKVASGYREYGPAKLKFQNQPTKLLTDLPPAFDVWVSHGDTVTEAPEGFICLASTENVRYAATAHPEKKIFGVQFHPEVEHTQYGKEILRNFTQKICGLETRERKTDVAGIINQIKETVGGSKVVAAVSGGVDSTTTAALIAKAVGQNFFPLYVESGLMRKGTKNGVNQIFQNIFKLEPIIVEAEKLFLERLKGITDPEEKRKIIGSLYIEIFEKEAKKIPEVKFLAQGTIYSDVIESKGTQKADKIKSHHNVGGLPEKMGLRLLEPLRFFYKDEVREIARELDLPDWLVYKQPFPGPGNAIRIIGEVTKERLEKQKQADEIILEEMEKAGWLRKVFQSFPVMTGIKSTAVKGDGRFWGEVVALRVYNSSDIMTTDWTRLPYDLLQKISSRIVNEVPGISRVVYDITTKPPATMEWE